MSCLTEFIDKDRRNSIFLSTRPALPPVIDCTATPGPHLGGKIYNLTSRILRSYTTPAIIYNSIELLGVSPSTRSSFYSSLAQLGLTYLDLTTGIFLIALRSQGRGWRRRFNLITLTFFATLSLGFRYGLVSNGTIVIILIL